MAGRQMNLYQKSARAVLSGALIAAAAPAWCAQYQSIGSAPAIFYDAPTLRGNKTFVAPRGMPVEVIVAQGDWVRVRDSTGGFAWVEKKALTDKRTVVAIGRSGSVNVRAGADESSPVVFRVRPGVLLDVVAAPASGWVLVRYQDGQSGYVKVSDVWGE